jgi:putative transposase
VKYAWIERHKKRWPITLQCEVLNVSASGYFEHQRRKTFGEPIKPGKRISDEALLVHIKAAHAASKGEYGWPRIWQELRANGVRVGKERVRRLMKQHGIKARGKRKFVVTTDSKHNLPIAPNLLNRNFQPDAPNCVWTSDITYIQTDEGWLYLAVVLDLYSRQVVGWSMQPHMQTSLVTDALRMAWFRRRPEPGLIFHSDRGSHNQ